MMLDGIQPVRDTFHSLIIGTMKGSRLEDAFYFRNEMKVMGLNPDVCSPPLSPFSVFFCVIVNSYIFIQLHYVLYFQVNLYNFLISVCGKCKDSNAALKVGFVLAIFLTLLLKGIQEGFLAKIPSQELLKSTFHRFIPQMNCNLHLFLGYVLMHYKRK
jgi:pentatricopeptide repeat protein